MPSRAARVAAALVAIALATAAPARAGDPSQVWRTIETEHFEVHYHEPLGEVARQVALGAERAHATLTAALRHEPSEKTHIVVVDDTDSANGFASVIPRNDITLFTSAPPDTSALGDHDSWLYNLVSHEYTHIVHLDTIGGLPRLYNRVFGKSWAPNQIQPRWVIEGLATYEESKRSASGRTRHALFDATLRLQTLAGNALRLDELSSDPRRFPHSNAAYLYGSHFLKFVFDRYGDDKAAAMSAEYGSTAIPYGLNRVMAHATGRSAIQLYDEWRTFREARYALDEEAVARAGRREGRRLTFTGENNLNPHFTSDGRWIVWQRGDGYSRGQFRIMPVGDNAGRSRTYVILERTGAFDLLQDGSMVVEQTATFRSNYDYQELWRWNRADGRMEVLTHGMRASDPAVSPDQREVAFVMNGESRRRLAVMALHREARPRIIWTGPGRWDQAFSPAWSPDGREIAFSAWRQGGLRDIVLVDLASGRARDVTFDRAQDSEPVYSPDGRYLYFNSDRTGIYNIYAWERATGALWQVTDVIGAALAPSVSPDGRRLVYQGSVADGDELFEVAIDPADWSPAPPYIDDRPDSVTIRADEAEVSAPRPYRAIETLAPRAFTLRLARYKDLGTALVVETSGNDVAGHHGYRLAASTGLSSVRSPYRMDYGDIALGGSYGYHRLWPSFDLALARNITNRGGYLVDGVNTRFHEEALRGTAGMNLPVLRAPDAQATLGIDYDIDWLRNLGGDLAEPSDPNDLLPRPPDTDLVFAGIAVRWSYSDTRGYTYTIGPQDGRDLALSLRLDHPALGSDTTTLTLTYRATFYRQVPMPTRPAVMLRLSGGIRGSDRPRVEQFAIGGVPESQDVVQSIIENARAATTGYLHGYPSGFVAGQQYHLVNTEWRQPLWDIERGIETLPVYLRRLHAAALVDAGDAFNDQIDLSNFALSVGAALRLDFDIGFGLGGSLELGYARGLTDGGIDELWLLLTGTL